MTMAAPIVIGNRMIRMAVAGPLPSGRDRNEMVRMGQEKVDALTESMVATATGVARVNQRLLEISTGQASTGATPKWAAVTPSLVAFWLQMVEGAIAPFHRRIMSNERRLLSS
jgi:hypothetical protein